MRNFGAGLYSLLGERDWFRTRHQNDSTPCCIGIYLVNSPEYVVAEYGAYCHSLVVVPIYDTLGPNACAYIANQGKSKKLGLVPKRINPPKKSNQIQRNSSAS